MSQININDPNTSDRGGAAGVNLVAVVIAAVLLVVLLWFLFTGPLAGFTGRTTGGDTNINVNPPAQEQPAPTAAPLPGGEQPAPAPPGGEQPAPTAAPTSP
ncbi:MAG TPA: hypothetical protein VNL77_04220 [Roseiflexaceae bacterium]|nr:hypothetical protein [Roseiflexaceae bacterium]